VPSTVESPGLGKLLMRFDHVIPKSIVVVSRWADLRPIYDKILPLGTVFGLIKSRFGR
jgi:hypothetical protein